MPKKLLIAIPTRNEKKTIRSLIEHIPRDLGLETKIILIDKSSENP